MKNSLPPASRPLLSALLLVATVVALSPGDGTPSLRRDSVWSFEGVSQELLWLKHDDSSGIQRKVNDRRLKPLPQDIIEDAN
jgi:hypothetical protein